MFTLPIWLILVKIYTFLWFLCQKIPYKRDFRENEREINTIFCQYSNDDAN